MHEFPRSGLQVINGSVLVLLCSLLFVLDLVDDVRVGLVPRGIALIQLLLEPLELDLVFPQESPLVDILINASLILDLLGSVGELERRLRLSKGVSRWRDHGHHGSLTVTTKGVLQDPGQLRISVRDVRSRLLISERGNNISESRK